MPQKVYPRKVVREHFLLWSKAKHADAIAKGEFPAPDVKISERIWGYSEGLLDKIQEQQMAAAAAETAQRAACDEAQASCADDPRAELRTPTGKRVKHRAANRAAR